MITGAIEHFNQPKGEFTLVLAGGGEKDKPQLTAEIEQRLSGMRQSGIRAREAIARIASETGLSRRELYRAWLKLL